MSNEQEHPMLNFPKDETILLLLIPEQRKAFLEYCERKNIHPPKRWDLLATILGSKVKKNTNLDNYPNDESILLQLPEEQREQFLIFCAKENIPTERRWRILARSLEMTKETNEKQVHKE